MAEPEKKFIGLALEDTSKRIANNIDVLDKRTTTLANMQVFRRPDGKTYRFGFNSNNEFGLVPTDELSTDDTGIDPDLIPENIKDGVDIYGVTGTFKGEVTNGVDTSDATVRPEFMLEGITAYGADGTKVTGTIFTSAGGTVTPGSEDITVPGKMYLKTDMTIKGDKNLQPYNIRTGKTIFGVTGDMDPSSVYDTHYCMVIKEKDFVDSDPSLNNDWYVIDVPGDIITNMYVVIGDDATMDFAYWMCQENGWLDEGNVDSGKMVPLSYLCLYDADGMPVRSNNHIIGWYNRPLEQYRNDIYSFYGCITDRNVDINNFTPFPITMRMYDVEKPELKIVPYGDGTYFSNVRFGYIPDEDSWDNDSMQIAIYQPYRCGGGLGRPEGSDPYTVHYIIEYCYRQIG